MEALGLTPLDFVALAVLVFTAIMGLSSGLVHSLLFIGAWLGAGVTAWHLRPVLQPELEKFVSSEQVAYFATLLGIFIIALMIFSMLASALGKMVQSSPFRIPDKILGLGFGAVCGAMLLSTAYLLYTYIAKPSDPPPAIISNARAYPMVKAGADMIEPYLPESFKTRARAAGRSSPPPSDPAGGGSPPAPAAPPPSPPSEQPAPKQ
ncbi:CvpA family protein [Vineibacter terrae]|uniref:CvpA family protein n=1 Tax=Vineibacter terrae TaxID=2586908 RepID=A0A5C8PWG9_9HYPH|nr:CvpA family protein [Vineibacter terrae]TXL82303.1 CvpA family protein [Vineibacter terrae]